LKDSLLVDLIILANFFDLATFGVFKIFILNLEI